MFRVAAMSRDHATADLGSNVLFGLDLDQEVYDRVLEAQTVDADSARLVVWVYTC